MTISVDDQDTLRSGSPTHVSRCKWSLSLSPNHPKWSPWSESLRRLVELRRRSDSARRGEGSGTLGAVFTEHASGWVGRRLVGRLVGGGGRGEGGERGRDRRRDSARGRKAGRVSKLALCLLITLQAVESAALTSPQWKRYLQLCSP